MTLAQQEQGELLQRLVAQVEANQETSNHGRADTDSILQILDDMDRGLRGRSDPELVASVLLRSAQQLTALAQIMPVATKGRLCPELGVLVVSSAASEHPAGTVCEILSQGYVAADGTILREARVIVSTVSDCTTSTSRKSSS